MKPNWKDAPPWAHYLAMDKSGYWYWYESRPIYDIHNGKWYGTGTIVLAGIFAPDSENSLEERDH